MDVFIGKQPIFNQNEQVVAYELLYRNKNFNAFPNIDQDEATIDVIINAFFTFGMEKLTENKPSFINFTGNLLMHDFIFKLNPQNVVVEILEDVTISEELIQRIQELKQAGFKIALDDYIYDVAPSPLMHRLFNEIDILKVDFMDNSPLQQMQIAHFFTTYYPQVLLLAEKVETRDVYNHAIESGYRMFQGYFFEQPKVVVSRDLEPVIVQYMELMNMLSSDEPDIDELSETIERDVSLTYKLLRLINTTVMVGRKSITSIRQAIMLLGLIELQKWIYVLAIRGNKSSTANDELIQISLFRSKVCEMLARQKGQQNYSEFFLVGMFSNIDGILQMKMEDIVKELPFSPVVIATINKEETEMTPYLNLAIALQKLNWEQISQYGAALNIPLESLEVLYATTSEWVENVLTPEEVTL
jgi:c-di-GMP phosphodiesterase